MIRLVVCDLDGTLIDTGNRCDPSVAETVRELQRRGIRFALCSGRPLDSVLWMLEGWRLAEITDYMIGSNGGEAEDLHTHERVVSYPLAPEVIRDIIDTYMPMGLTASFYTADILYVSEITEQVKKVAGRLAIGLEKGDVRAMFTKPELKEMMIVEPERMAEIEKYYAAHPDDRYIAFKTANDLFEFNHPKLAKDVGLRLIAERMGISPEEIMAFGDTTNDIAMFRYAKYGICMDNGSEDAKAAAYDIAPSITDRGFATYINKHIFNTSLL
ncbi:MAG: Cof-type HAD-IIB family hydrolase [Solobacterium sp.]|nr:Cof-type HAD-IIB family hydrolase [Solobacterium sp.]